MPDLEALSRDELIALCLQQWEVIQQLQAEVSGLRWELERLRKDPPAGTARAVPSFVKPNRAPRPEGPRKKRPQAYVRRREEPTRVVEHAVEHCPDCGRRLAGGWVHRVRQVIEVPLVRYEVVEHRLLGRHCGACRKNHVAVVDFSGEVVGQHRMGVRLMSLLVHLKHGCRMTVRSIQRLLGSLWGLHLSIGEISEALHAVARRGGGLYQSLREQVRGSPQVHGDETSWRENGQNHWLWSFSTPRVRLFAVEKSRGHQVPARLLGEEYDGILSSDFYAGYSYYRGRHQRCWVHFLRDLNALEEEYPQDARVRAFVRSVRSVWKAARAYESESLRERMRAKEALQDRLFALALPYARAEGPVRTLAQRITRFVEQMFTFVEHKDVPPDNNAAERALRPAVIYRKVCGGTRSPRGSQTAAVLMSLVGTWTQNGQNTLTACAKMLRHEERT